MELSPPHARARGGAPPAQIRGTNIPHNTAPPQNAYRTLAARIKDLVNDDDFEYQSDCALIIHEDELAFPLVELIPAWIPVAVAARSVGW